VSTTFPTFLCSRASIIGKDKLANNHNLELVLHINEMSSSTNLNPNPNGWNWDENYRRYWRYALDYNGSYKLDAHGKTSNERRKSRFPGSPNARRQPRAHMAPRKRSAGGAKHHRYQLQPDFGPTLTTTANCSCNTVSTYRS
jgi:hypothetical protein